MALPDRPGNYRAIVSEATLSQTKGGEGKTVKAQFVAKYVLTEFYYAPEKKWYPLDPGPEITGYFVLENNNGELNEWSIRSLIEGLGWDAKSIASLGTKDWAGTRCQVYIADEPNQQGTGTDRRVKSMRAYDADPAGMAKPLDAAELKSTGTRLDSKLRAIAPTLGAKKAGTPSPQPKAPENMDAEPAYDLPHI